MAHSDDDPTDIGPVQRGVMSEASRSGYQRHRPAPSLDGARTPPARSEATKLIRPGGKDAESGAEDGVGEVAGWLVIVSGPGRGADFRLSYGINRIGRESGDIKLDFGDETISRGAQLRVTAEPRSNRFFVQQDEGRNVVYLDDGPLLQPTEIASGARIQLGNTHLMLVVFSPDFHDWTSDEPVI